ncbi:MULTISPECIES: family 43 glycosylhydrolase [unclassified Sphingomonas]|uniref:family 43 glycosylhydrolase n=1 Tax=unclassified Sphingomonas TaxID=196159 RepID=UPI0006FB89A6|nr:MULTISPECIES: family 43 glycosylhydrolase [unclassified Sphingomonas]KQM66310.1 glycosyl hydrolase family 43 [Sphingomonas sp. Leaf16]KQN08766.1 glycosyl hydrolase family 43 [Sphingomonas sp. Leaf29]KQN17348.1 glycosyl hydrolase family 43 [Sphingomonas sp. Leaf32]
MRRIALLAAFLPASLLAQSGPVPETIHSRGNPILSDGRYYSTDPAPFVDGDTLWILAGRDEAPAGVNDFVMNEWQLLATTDPKRGTWRHYPAIARPEAVFAWAEPGRAYAGQIVKGRNGRFYLYAPVLTRDDTAQDRFAIGVAVADRPTGPWRDAHPAGPIVSQRVPVANDIQNIDPTVLIDDDRRVYLYWGTFGRLRGVELAADMVTPIGEERAITGLTGFFEAPWLMKRHGTYYLLYAANNAGPDSPCTPALYHACQAYGTAPSPLGPWTYRGVLLAPVSSTTSHAGAVAFKGQWYLAYHTADAKGGGHFRRSVALDRLEWDDSVSPAAIRRVVPTRAPRARPAPTRNVAPSAAVYASNAPIPTQYWIRALNDGLVRTAPLPPDMWGTWTGANPPRPWIEYRWPRPVTLTGSRIFFFADQPAGSGIGVVPPAAWHLEYWAGAWKTVPGASGYATGADAWQAVEFPPLTTRCLRAVFDASQAGGSIAGIGVQEWEALAPTAAAPRAAPVAPVPPCDEPAIVK